MMDPQPSVKDSAQQNNQQGLRSDDIERNSFVNNAKAQIFNKKARAESLDDGSHSMLGLSSKDGQLTKSSKRQKTDPSKPTQSMDLSMPADLSLEATLGAPAASAWFLRQQHQIAALGPAGHPFDLGSSNLATSGSIGVDHAVSRLQQQEHQKQQLESQQESEDQELTSPTLDSSLSPRENASFLLRQQQQQQQQTQRVGMNGMLQDNLDSITMGLDATGRGVLSPQTLSLLGQTGAMSNGSVMGAPGVAGMPGSALSLSGTAMIPTAATSLLGSGVGASMDMLQQQGFGAAMGTGQFGAASPASWVMPQQFSSVLSGLQGSSVTESSQNPQESGDPTFGPAPSCGATLPSSRQQQVFRAGLMQQTLGPGLPISASPADSYTNFLLAQQAGMLGMGGLPHAFGSVDGTDPTSSLLMGLQSQQGLMQQRIGLLQSTAGLNRPGISSMTPSGISHQKLYSRDAIATEETKGDEDGSKPVILYMACDDESLSEYQCLVRKQIEVFEAVEEDVDSNAQGRNKPIILGQVGIRCRHCSKIPPRHRTRGATYYPAKLNGLYQAAQNMASAHLCNHCQLIPDALRQELITLRDRKSSAGGGKQYWADGVRVLGVVEADDVLKFAVSPDANSSAGDVEKGPTPSDVVGEINNREDV